MDTSNSEVSFKGFEAGAGAEIGKGGKWGTSAVVSTIKY